METTITLSNEDAERFKSFQQHYDLFKMLEDKGAFTVQFGKVVLNIAFGEIQNCTKEEIVWKR